MNEAPSTRHGDVLLTVWIVVGATVLVVLSLSQTLRMPSLALAVIGAASAGYGETVARALRPHVRFVDTAAAIVIAFMLLPIVARFGTGGYGDDAIVIMAVGTPLGVGAAWQTRRWNARPGNFPHTVAAVFIIAAAVALAVVSIVSLDVLPGRHTLELGFLVLATAGGLTFGGLVAEARPGHLVLGALFVLLAPRLISIGCENRTLTSALVQFASGQRPYAPPAEPEIVLPYSATFEVVGDYAGRELSLTINPYYMLMGRLILLPSGESWKETIPVADENPLTLRMEIEGCEPFEGQFRPGPNMATLIVEGCTFRLVQDE